jgi:hypothetical protein
VQCHTGATQRTNEHYEMKCKHAEDKTERQNQIEAKKLQAGREAELEYIVTASHAYHFVDENLYLQ